MRICSRLAYPTGLLLYRSAHRVPRRRRPPQERCSRSCRRGLPFSTPVTPGLHPGLLPSRSRRSRTWVSGEPRPSGASASPRSGSSRSGWPCRGSPRLAQSLAAPVHGCGALGVCILDPLAMWRNRPIAKAPFAFGEHCSRHSRTAARNIGPPCPESVAALAARTRMAPPDGGVHEGCRNPLHRLRAKRHPEAHVCFSMLYDTLWQHQWSDCKRCRMSSVLA
jgi:hypothetical protein